MNKQIIIDTFKRQWPRIKRNEIDIFVRETGGISAFEAVFLYLLVLDRAPRYVVEFSPNHGYSTKAIAMALRVLGIKNRFATFEIKKSAFNACQKGMINAGLNDYVETIFGDAIEKVPEWINSHDALVDLCFVDSDHSTAFANKYINNIFPLLQNNCLIGVHDICTKHKSDDGKVIFHTSLKAGKNKTGEEKPVLEYVKEQDYCVLHSITGGKHENANLAVNNEFYNEILEITGIDFRKAKCKACPKTLFFNRKVLPTKPKPKPLPVNNSGKDQHLFILGMNDSGTTFLQNSLSVCANCVSFQHPTKRPNGIEGQGAAWWKQRNKNWYPRDIDHEVVKIFSQKKHIWQKPDRFNWGEIKKAWAEAWGQNPHFKTANPRIFLEKTPSSLFSVDMYLEHYPNAKFLIIHRNPYAVAEGTKRTVKQHKKRDYSWEQCAQHWVECTRQQIENIKRLVPDRAIWFKYEELVTKPGNVESKIKKFIPELGDVNFRTNKVRAHSMDDPKQPRAVVNYNNRHLKNIDKEGFTKLNKIFEANKDLLDFFEYVIRTKAP